MCSVLVLSNSPYRRDMDITDAGLVNLAGGHQPLASPDCGCEGAQGGGGGGHGWGWGGLRHKW